MVVGEIEIVSFYAQLLYMPPLFFDAQPPFDDLLASGGESRLLVSPLSNGLTGG